MSQDQKQTPKSPPSDAPLTPGLAQKKMRVTHSPPPTPAPREISTPVAHAQAASQDTPVQKPVLKARPTGGTRCIYFRDLDELVQLEELCKRSSRGSVSAVIQQLVKSALEAASQSAPTDLVINLNTKIYL